jgi:hypothetical protein
MGRFPFAAALMAVLALETFAQEKKEKGDPDLLYKKEVGVSINKPPKNDEWEFKDHVFWTNSQLAVSHKVDTVFVEITYQEKAPGASYYDPKKGAEDEWKNFSTSPNFKDCKKVGEIKSAKLPNGGANNPMSYLLDMTFKDKADKPMEMKMWSFVGKENQNYYKVFVIGDEGTYKKHQKNIDVILGSIRIYRVK